MNDRSKNGTLVDATTVRFERLLPGPIERVWEHLTRPELLSTWLCKAASTEVRAGGHVELTAAIKSEVSFELEPRGDEVLLVLTHRRVDLKYVPQVLAGWHTLLDGLEMRMRGTPAFRFMDRFESDLALYPAKT